MSTEISKPAPGEWVCIRANSTASIDQVRAKALEESGLNLHIIVKIGPSQIVEGEQGVYDIPWTPMDEPGEEHVIRFWNKGDESELYCATAPKEFLGLFIGYAWVDDALYIPDDATALYIGILKELVVTPFRKREKIAEGTS